MSKTDEAKIDVLSLNLLYLFGGMERTNTDCTPSIHFPFDVAVDKQSLYDVLFNRERKNYEYPPNVFNDLYVINLNNATFKQVLDCDNYNDLQPRSEHSSALIGDFLVFIGGYCDYMVDKLIKTLLFDYEPLKNKNEMFGDDLCCCKKEMLEKYVRNAQNKKLIQIYNTKTGSVYTPINCVTSFNNMPDNPSDLIIHTSVVVNDKIFVFDKKTHYTFEISQNGEKVKWSSSCINTSHGKKCKDGNVNVMEYLSQMKCQYDKSSDEIILTKFFYNLEMEVIRLNPNKFGDNGYIISTSRLNKPTFLYGNEFRNFNCYVSGLVNGIIMNSENTIDQCKFNDSNDELTGTSYIYEALLNIEKSAMLPAVGSCVWCDIGEHCKILLLVVQYISRVGLHPAMAGEPQMVQKSELFILHVDKNGNEHWYGNVFPVFKDLDLVSSYNYNCNCKSDSLFGERRTCMKYQHKLYLLYLEVM